MRAEASKRCRQLGKLHRDAAPNGRAVQCTAPAHCAESPAWPQLTVQEALHSPSTRCRRLAWPSTQCRRLAWPSTQWRKLAWPSTQYRKCEVSHQTTIVGDCADRQTGILVVAQDTLHWQWCVCVHRVGSLTQYKLCAWQRSVAWRGEIFHKQDQRQLPETPTNTKSQRHSSASVKINRHNISVPSTAGSA